MKTRIPKSKYKLYSEVYSVRERYDPDAPPEWYEYEVALLDSDGDIVDEWDSYSETYNGIQKLDRAGCKAAIAEIRKAVKAGNWADWFTIAS